jgi:hypothetical protein
MPVVVGLLVAIGVGVMAYNAGVAHGLAQSGPPAAAAYPYHWGHPWGLGFGFFFPVLFGFLLLRLIFWGGFGYRRWHRHYGWYGAGPYDVPPAFEEWHRRAHEGGRHDPGATSV